MAAALLVVVLCPGPGRADSYGWFDKALQLELTDANLETRRRTATLEGSVFVYHVLVNQPRADWTAFDTRQVAERVQDALSYVTARAAEYGTAVTWSQEWKFVYLDERLTNVRDDTSWADEVIEAAVGVPSADFLARLTSREEIDRAVIAIHLNAKGLSFCRPWAGQFVVFNRTAPVYWKGTTLALGARTHAYSRPSVYVHELLHAFGAEDLYAPEERKERALQCAPDDIMLNPHTELDKLAIGNHTAALLGWRRSGPRDCWSSAKR